MTVDRLVNYLVNYIVVKKFVLNALPWIALLMLAFINIADISMIPENTRYMVVVSVVLIIVFLVLVAYYHINKDLYKITTESDWILETTHFKGRVALASNRKYVAHIFDENDKLVSQCYGMETLEQASNWMRDELESLEKFM